MADKTLGDYAVDAEKAMANNNCNGLDAVTAEMYAAAPPVDPEAPEVAPPPPEDLGLRGFADALAACARDNNVAQARKLTEDMKTLYPPSPPPATPPA